MGSKHGAIKAYTIWIVCHMHLPPGSLVGTFEEAFYTGFFKIKTKIFSPINQEPRSRYVAFMRMEVERPLRDVIKEVEHEDRVKRMRAALQST